MSPFSMHDSDDSVVVPSPCMFAVFAYILFKLTVDCFIYKNKNNFRVILIECKQNTMTEVVKVIIRERPSISQSDVVIRHCDFVKNVRHFLPFVLCVKLILKICFF